ncbi:AzlD domain-containing protein [Enterococcus termitis]|jgi:branched-subunit amino acid transport protein|uniref:Branched-chain amino acid ABC transporter n=1 Tax=Enterococcus termitis TaxID=332950 RepID=A0A1E5G832_9ENTE|nr:AzlD domain-containing protein [Enterococcus termitis]OEG08765.1 branched-chain amino acid ABC transporter [Enterococcus termitis]
MNNYVLLTILGCSLVTWIPRIIPFLISKRVDFPKWFLRFLSFIPICILTALLFQSILEAQTSGFPKLKLLEAISCIPTLLVAIRTKDLMKTVVVGIVTIAVLRIFLG